GCWEWAWSSQRRKRSWGEKRWRCWGRERGQCQRGCKAWCRFRRERWGEGACQRSCRRGQEECWQGSWARWSRG
ncbi:hypothetical protein COCVIDRAFT_88162, partial [Bipolaris victoriae FI3]